MPRVPRQAQPGCKGQGTAGRDPGSRGDPTPKPEIADAVVSVRDSDETSTLVAYLVPDGGTIPTTGELRRELADALPPHMIPSRYVFLDAFPLDGNGKVERTSLPEPSPARPHLRTPYLAPRDQLEALLAEIWQRVLGVEPVGVLDDFFELGGDSLLVASLTAEVEDKCGVSLPASAIGEEFTVQRCARALSERAPGDERFPFVAFNGDGEQEPFFYLYGDYVGGPFYCRRLAGALGPEQPLYAIHPHGLSGEPMPESIEEMAQERVSLLLSFHSGPYRLGGFCQPGGLVAYEMACQLEALDAEVELLALVGSNPPNRRLMPLRPILSHVVSLAPLNASSRERLYLGARHLQRRFGKRPLRSNGSNSIAIEAFRRDRGAAYRVRELEFVPRRYQGRIVLLWPQGDPAPVSGGPTMGWLDAGAQVDVQLIPGDHLTSVTTHVDELARRLSRLLDDRAR